MKKILITGMVLLFSQNQVLAQQKQPPEEKTIHFAQQPMQCGSFSVDSLLEKSALEKIFPMAQGMFL